MENISCHSPSTRGSAKSYQRCLADRWGKFIRENYPSAEHAAIAFGVTAKTAHNWMEGSNKPNGAVVAAAFMNPRTNAILAGYM